MVNPPAPRNARRRRFPATALYALARGAIGMVGAGLGVVAPVMIAAPAVSGTAIAATTATIEATAGGPLDAGSRIALVTADPGERTRLLLPAIARVLAARGFVIDDAADLRLKVAAAVGAGSDRPPFRLEGTIGSDSRPDVTLEVPLPEWPGRRREDPGYRLAIAMTLGAGGRPALWQGSATMRRPTPDDLAAEQALAATLAARVGLSVSAVRVPID